MIAYDPGLTIPSTNYTQNLSIGDSHTCDVYNLLSFQIHMGCKDFDKEQKFE